VVKLEAGGVGRRLFDGLRLGGCAGGLACGREIEVQPHRLRQQVRGVAVLQQLRLGLLQSCEVRHLLQFQVRAQRRVVRDDRDDAAVVGLVELPQHKQSEQLRLGEVLAAEPAGVVGQAPPPDRVRHRSHPPW